LKKTIARENETNLKNFYASDQLDLAIGKDEGVVKEEISGEDQSDVDDEYVKRNQQIISENETGRVSAGYNKVTHQAVIIKESQKNPNKKIDPEKYLVDKKFDIASLSLPIKRLESDQKIVRVYEAAETDLERYIRSHDRLSPKLALSIIIRLSDVTGKLHKLNIIHGDIAPSNVLLYRDGIKLSDIDDSYVNNFIKKGSGGNRFIMAPEMFAGEEGSSINKTVDIYALSADLYYMLTGTWPHKIADQDLSPEERQAKYKELHEKEKIIYPDSIPTALKSILQKGLAPNPSERYQSTDYFLNDLLKAYNSL